MDGQSQLWRWVAGAKARGQGPFLLTVLDAIEPLGPALAAGLLVAQPLAGWWRHEGALRELADLLEEPAGFESLRRALAEESME